MTEGGDPWRLETATRRHLVSNRAGSGVPSAWLHNPTVWPTTLVPWAARAEKKMISAGAVIHAVHSKGNVK